MPSDGGRAADREFLQLDGRVDSHGEPLILSRAAFELHGHGIINSVRNDTPGFVSDARLQAISADAPVHATELCTVGLWLRADNGYEIQDREMLEIAIEQVRRRDESARCAASGGHERAPDSRPICGRCGTPIT